MHVCLFVFVHYMCGCVCVCVCVCVLEELTPSSVDASSFTSTAYSGTPETEKVYNTLSTLHTMYYIQRLRVYFSLCSIPFLPSIIHRALWV